MASKIAFISLSSVQATGFCQFLTECVAPTHAVNVPLCILGNTRPGQKVPGLSSEGALPRHCVAQDRTVKHTFYLGAVRRVRDAVRRNDQQMAACCVANRSAPVHLAQRVQSIVAEHHVPQECRPQDSPHIAPCEFIMITLLPTP